MFLTMFGCVKPVYYSFMQFIMYSMRRNIEYDKGDEV